MFLEDWNKTQTLNNVLFQLVHTKNVSPKNLRSKLVQIEFTMFPSKFTTKGNKQTCFLETGSGMTKLSFPDEHTSPAHSRKTFFQAKIVDLWWG